MDNHGLQVLPAQLAELWWHSRGETCSSPLRVLDSSSVNCLWVVVVFCFQKTNKSITVGPTLYAAPARHCPALVAADQTQYASNADTCRTSTVKQAAFYSTSSTVEDTTASHHLCTRRFFSTVSDVGRKKSFSACWVLWLVFLSLVRVRSRNSVCRVSVL